VAYTGRGTLIIDVQKPWPDLADRLAAEEAPEGSKRTELSEWADRMRVAVGRLGEASSSARSSDKVMAKSAGDEADAVEADLSRNLKDALDGALSSSSSYLRFGSRR
jgi:hypothetical protein